MSAALLANFAAKKAMDKEYTFTVSSDTVFSLAAGDGYRCPVRRRRKVFADAVGGVCALLPSFGATAVSKASAGTVTLMLPDFPGGWHWFGIELECAAAALVMSGLAGEESDGAFYRRVAESVCATMEAAVASPQLISA